MEKIKEKEKNVFLMGSKVLSPSMWKEKNKDYDSVIIKKILLSLNSETSVEYFLMLDKERKVDVFNEFDWSEKIQLIENISNKSFLNILEYMQPDDLVDFFREVSSDIRESVWTKLSSKTREEVQFLLRFDCDDAAGIMTPRYVAVKQDITIEATIAFIRANIDIVETIYYIYVVDALGRLQGVASLRDIIKQKDTVRIKECMVRMVVTVREDSDKKEVVMLLEKHNLLAIPVVDAFYRLQGIITVDDGIDVMREEYEEDVLQMSAIGTTANSKSYLENSVWEHVRTRVPWLILLLVAGTLTSNLLNFFSKTITLASYLVWFIPVCNIIWWKIQRLKVSTLMIRGLTKGEIAFKNVFKIITKEIQVALLIGIVLAIVMLLRGMFFFSTYRFT